MASTEVVNLARRVRAARALSGKSAEQLAAELGISTRSYWRLEAGDRRVDALELERIARATGQALAFFLGTATSPDPEEALTLPPPLPGFNEEPATT